MKSYLTGQHSSSAHIKAGAVTKFKNSAERTIDHFG